MKYVVTIMDTFPAHHPSGLLMRTERACVGLTLRQAWQVADRACKRGLRLYGGGLEKRNWGLTTGNGEHSAILNRCVRHATITVDYNRRLRRKRRGSNL